jgi:hypothetical protein
VKRAASRCQLCSSEEGQTIRRTAAEHPQHRERLQRLAEAHLVREDSAKAIPREKAEPAHPLLLVRAEHLLQRAELHRLQLLRLPRRFGPATPRRWALNAHGVLCRYGLQ